MCRSLRLPVHPPVSRIKWKLVELSRYLKRWESALRNGKDDPTLQYEPVKIGISTKKFVEQGRKEKLRSLRARLTAP